MGESNLVRRITEFGQALTQTGNLGQGICQLLLFGDKKVAKLRHGERILAGLLLSLAVGPLSFRRRTIECRATASPGWSRDPGEIAGLGIGAIAHSDINVIE
jgi:hypothetical protein